MNEFKSPGYARVFQPFGAEIPVVHCPICGTATQEGSDEEGWSLNPCPHLEFIYTEEGFEYQTEECQRRLEDIDLDEIVEFSDALEQAGYDEKLLAIDITFGGMSCGPVWYSVVWGFDYGKTKKLETS